MQTRVLVFAGAMAVFMTLVGVLSDVRGLRLNDDVAQDAHLRGVAVGVVAACVLLVLQRRAQRGITASPAAAP
jgi:membrane associated rhomboid family serine protease